MSVILAFLFVTTLLLLFYLVTDTIVLLMYKVKISIGNRILAFIAIIMFWALTFYIVSENIERVKTWDKEFVAEVFEENNQQFAWVEYYNGCEKEKVNLTKRYGKIFKEDKVTFILHKESTWNKIRYTLKEEE